MENIKSYILSIISAAIICGSVSILLNKNTIVGQLARLLSGVFVTVTVISPFVDLSFVDITEYMNSINADADVYVEEGKEFSRSQISDIIKAQVEAYILDKADKMNCEITVDVGMSENNDPVPVEVTICGDVSPYAKEIIGSYIEDTFGIVRGSQNWK